MQNLDRQQAILELISTAAVSRQDELAKMLLDRGFTVTQASVSRDLEKLGIVKINGRYMLQPPVRIGAFGRVSFTPAGENLIVIKCGSGLASAAAVHIDAAAILDIVGTIAGDDTIFVAVKGLEEQARVTRSLRNILETNEGNGNN